MVAIAYKSRTLFDFLCQLTQPSLLCRHESYRHVLKATSYAESDIIYLLIHDCGHMPAISTWDVDKCLSSSESICFSRAYLRALWPQLCFNIFITWSSCTGWLKLKYPTGQNAIDYFSTTVWDFYTQISWFMWERSYKILTLKNILVFSKVGYINILCHIFNSVWNIQQQLVIFIHVMVVAGVCFGAFNSKQDQPPKWMQNFMLKHCCRNLFKIADLFCHLASSDNRMAHLHTWQSWLKAGLLPTAVNSLVKMNGLRICLTSTLWTTMSGELGLCLNATSHFNPSRRTPMSSRKFCSWYGTSCHAQDSINKAILSFPKRLQACAKAGGGHFEHTLKWTTCEIFWYL